jgi:hypothetical protein
MSPVRLSAVSPTARRQLRRAISAPEVVAIPAADIAIAIEIKIVVDVDVVPAPPASPSPSTAPERSHHHADAE